MEKPKHIIFANTAEAFEDILNSASGSEEGQKRIRHELALSQRAFFWEGDNKIVITPTPIPRELFELNSNLLGNKNTLNYSPNSNSLNLSKPTKNQAFLGYISGVKELQFSPYAITQSFLDLLQFLTENGIKTTADSLPKTKGYNLVKYLDSKSGFRKEIERFSDGGVFIPKGFICQTLEDLRNKINYFKVNNKNFVVKADQGESGWGLIISQNNQPTLDEILYQVSTETIWANGPYIVEEFIEVDASAGGGTSSTELFVTDSEVRVTYLCGQVVENGEFQGTIVGKDALPDNVAEEITRSGIVIGKHYQSLGYRGIFDIDYVISKTGAIFAVETNARRTGGTHVYDLARRLFGEYFINHCFVSNDHFEYKKDFDSISSLLTRISSVLYSKDTQSGIVITLINEIDRVLGYISIGKDPDEANKFADKLKNLLS